MTDATETADQFAALLAPLFYAFTQTDDPEKRAEAASQLGALKNRCEHSTRYNPNPSQGQELIQGLARLQLAAINGLLATADAEQLRSLIEGVTWSIHNQT